jgi:VWFA-related protein
MRMLSICLASSCLITQAAAAQSPAAPPQSQKASVTSPTNRPATGATAPDDKPATISVDTKLVNLPVVVRDKKGALVQNLTKTDFTLQVDGKPQTIRYFDKDTNLPLTLGLLVDTSQSQRSVLDDERSASSAFIDNMLAPPADGQPKDKAFVLQFAKSVELLEDVTSSRPKLQAALKEIGDTIPSQTTDDDNSNSGSNNGNSGNNGNGGNGRNGGNGNGNSPRRYSGGTTLYDSLFLASDELMSKQTGRKALIILSDGNDRGSKESLAKSIEAAQRADTIVYAIYFKGEESHDNYNDTRPRGGGMGRFPGGGYPGGGGGGYPRGGGTSSTSGEGKKVLDRMARETGGRLFEVSKKQTTAQIYTQIAEELRAQYRLGYTPDAAGASDGYHQVDLALTNSHDKNLIVQTRDGYYTGK